MSDAVLSKIEDIMRIMFNSQSLAVTPQTEAADVDGWDSLAHASLMVMIERAFGIEITEDESGDLDCVGDLVDLVKLKKGI